jgi:hypothetical protein
LWITNRIKEAEMNMQEYARIVEEMAGMMVGRLINVEDVANETFLLSELDWDVYFGSGDGE